MWSQLTSLLNLVPGPVRYILAVVVGLVFIGIAFWAGGGGTALAIFIGILVIIGLLYLIGFIGRRMEKRRNAAMESVLGDAKDDLAQIPDQELRREREMVQDQWGKAVAELRGAGFNHYTLPWYMLIGEPAGGKSTTLRASGLEFPVGAEAISGVGGTRNCDWWFTNEAVILDTAGRFTFDEKNAPDQAGWLEFLNLLKRFRPRCPVNGVIIAIPCTSLLEDKLDRIEQNALKIRDKLHELQRQLEIQFPVWILITKADKLFGFTEFFSRLPALELRRQLFGWSNPDQFDRPVDHSRWDSIFGDLQSSLQKWRNQFLEDDCEAGDVDRLYAFPDEFAGITEPLELYLKTIFSDNRYVDPLFLRGFYFTSGIQRGAPILHACANLLRSTSGGSRDEMDLESIFSKPRAFFIRDFYRQKVFKEQGMIRPTRLAYRRRRLVERVGYSAVAIVSITLLTALIYGGASASGRAAGLTERIEELGAEDVRYQPMPVARAKEFSAEIRRVYQEGLYPGFLQSTLFPGASTSAIRDGKLEDSYRDLLVFRNFTGLGTQIRDRFRDPKNNGPRTWEEYAVFRDAFYEYLAFATGNASLPNSITERRESMKAMVDLLGMRDGVEPLPSGVSRNDYAELYADLLALRRDVGTNTEGEEYPDVSGAFPLKVETLELFLACFEDFYQRALRGQLEGIDAGVEAAYARQALFVRLVDASEGMRKTWIDLRRFDFSAEKFTDAEKKLEAFDALSTAPTAYRGHYQAMLEAIDGIQGVGGFADFREPGKQLQQRWTDEIYSVLAGRPKFEELVRDRLADARGNVSQALEDVTGRLDLDKDQFAFFMSKEEVGKPVAKPRESITKLGETLAAASSHFEAARKFSPPEPYRFVDNSENLVARFAALEKLVAVPMPAEIEPLLSVGSDLSPAPRTLPATLEALAAFTKKVAASQEVKLFADRLAADRGAGDEGNYSKFRQEFVTGGPDARLSSPLGNFGRRLTEDLQPAVATELLRVVGIIAGSKGVLYTEVDREQDRALGQLINSYVGRYRREWSRVIGGVGELVAGKESGVEEMDLPDMAVAKRLADFVALARSAVHIPVPDSLGGAKAQLQDSFALFRASFPAPPSPPEPKPGEESATPVIDPVETLLAEYARHDEASKKLSAEAAVRSRVLSPGEDGSPTPWVELTTFERSLEVGRDEQKYLDDLSKGLRSAVEKSRKDIEGKILKDYSGEWRGIGARHRPHLDKFPFRKGDSSRQVIQQEDWKSVVKGLREFDGKWETIELERGNVPATAVPFAFMNDWLTDVRGYRKALLGIDRFVRDGEEFRKYQLTITLDPKSDIDNVRYSIAGVNSERIPPGTTFGNRADSTITWDFNRNDQAIRLIATYNDKDGAPFPPVPDQAQAAWSQWLGLVMFFYTYMDNDEHRRDGGRSDTLLHQRVDLPGEPQRSAYYKISWIPRVELGPEPNWSTSRWDGI